MTDTFIHCMACKADKPLTEFYASKRTTCKDCFKKARNTKHQASAHVYQSVDEFRDAYETHLAERGTKFKTLKRYMFATDGDFNAAKQMQKDNKLQTIKTCQQRPEARERANEQARTAYHNKTAEQKLEKSRADDINKKKRKRSTPSGFCWCEYTHACAHPCNSTLGARTRDSCRPFRGDRARSPSLCDDP